jgi:hypothetical protein
VRSRYLDRRAWWALCISRDRLEQRLQYYFHIRPSDHDLLGDLDAWGLQALREADPPVNKIGTLLAQYYEDQKLGLIESLTVQRKVALERFLGHYGFKYDRKTDLVNYPVLINQGALRRMEKEIQLFGHIWMIRRSSSSAALPDEYTRAQYSDKMAQMLAWWLEGCAIEYGVEVK